MSVIKKVHYRPQPVTRLKIEGLQHQLDVCQKYQQHLMNRFDAYTDKQTYIDVILESIELLRWAEKKYLLDLYRHIDKYLNFLKPGKRFEEVASLRRDILGRLAKFDNLDEMPTATYAKKVIYNMANCFYGSIAIGKDTFDSYKYHRELVRLETQVKNFNKQNIR